MKFTNGFWLDRKGWQVERGRCIRSVRPLEEGDTANSVELLVATKNIRTRGDTLNTGVFTVTYTPIAPGVIRVRQERWKNNSVAPISPEIKVPTGFIGRISHCAQTTEVSADNLLLRIPDAEDWGSIYLCSRIGQDSAAGTNGPSESFKTSFPARSLGLAISPEGRRYSYAQVELSPGERIYGLGERFGNFVKNGQSVDIWNEDGGTASEQAYKNIPFYISSAGYGLLVLNSGEVSFEIGSEAVSRVQFSVPGDVLEYLIIDGSTPKEILERYTDLTGRAPRVPSWSYGLWLTTSFTTSYDEKTVMSFINGMAERGLPLSVFHFDCFWMREFHWCDFVWDPKTFPDPEGLIRRIKEKGLKICVWINPYIAQASHLWQEAADLGYLVKRTDDTIWHTDLWQAGMSLVDFTNPEAAQWYQDKIKVLLEMGVDCFKTDFGERIPVRDIAWFDGSDPVSMHNHYAFLYNRAVFSLLKKERGEGDAVLFARSAATGSQTMPVHWGGDCDSSFASMGETLRGGLSLAMSGFAYWSHDIGGFEGSPDPSIFKRWLQFGLLSSHSRLHGSDSVRVPWAFDEESVEITRKFTNLKMTLMPYIVQAAREAELRGIPIMRPMFLEFPDDKATWEIDTQYMLGENILVAPIFNKEGIVDYYLPAGQWTSLLDGHVVEGPTWVREQHDNFSLPIMVRDGAVLPLGSTNDRPDYQWSDNINLRCFGATDVNSEVRIPRLNSNEPGEDIFFKIDRRGEHLSVETNSPYKWNVEVNGEKHEVREGCSTFSLDLDC